MKQLALLVLTILLTAPSTFATESKALVRVQATDRERCQLALETGGWFARRRAAKILQKMDTEYYGAMADLFPGLLERLETRHALRIDRKREKIFEIIEGSPHLLGKPDVFELISKMRDFDPSEAIREKAAVMLADPPTYEKLNQKKEKEFSALAPQRALIFEKIGFWGAEDQRYRIGALYQLAKRALSLSESDREALAEIAIKDKAEEVRVEAKRLLELPVETWYRTWERFSSVSAHTGILENFEDRVYLLNDLEKQAVAYIGDRGAWGSSSLAERARRLRDQIFMIYR